MLGEAKSLTPLLRQVCSCLCVSLLAFAPSFCWLQETVWPSWCGDIWSGRLTSPCRLPLPCPAPRLPSRPQRLYWLQRLFSRCLPVWEAGWWPRGPHRLRLAKPRHCIKEAVAVLAPNRREAGACSVSRGQTKPDVLLAFCMVSPSAFLTHP